MTSALPPASTPADDEREWSRSPGVYVHPGPETAFAAIERFARARDIRLARIDFHDCTDKTSVLERFASSLEFPDWFGGNWDALEDSLNDLEWLGASCHLLSLEQLEPMRRSAPGDFAVLLDILRTAVAQRRQTGDELWVLVDARIDEDA